MLLWNISMSDEIPVSKIAFQQCVPYMPIWKYYIYFVLENAQTFKYTTLIFFTSLPIKFGVLCKFFFLKLLQLKNGL